MDRLKRGDKIMATKDGGDFKKGDIGIVIEAKSGFFSTDYKISLRDGAKQVWFKSDFVEKSFAKI